MRTYWWQGGVHIDPETDDNWDFLLKVINSLECTDLISKIPSSPVVIVDADDQDPVI